jgi:hypothetical protein
MGHARAVARSLRRVLIVAVPPVRTLDLFGAVMDRTRINRRDLRVGTTAAVVRFFDSVGRFTLPQTPAEANPSADTLLGENYRYDLDAGSNFLPFTRNGDARSARTPRLCRTAQRGQPWTARRHRRH